MLRSDFKWTELLKFEFVPNDLELDFGNLRQSVK